MLTDEHTQKLGLLNQLLIAGSQDQYVPSAHDKEFLQRKFPNIYGTPKRTTPETRQLDIFGDHEKWKVESTPNNRGMSIANAPRRIKGSAPANVIWRAPDLDSPVIDNWIKRGFTPGMDIPKPKGPQLFPLAQISPTDTPKDLRIQDAVKRFGKDPKTGKYIDPTLLIQHLLKEA